MIVVDENEKPTPGSLERRIYDACCDGLLEAQDALGRNLREDEARIIISAIARGLLADHQTVN
jgi:hypothetical protein